MICFYPIHLNNSEAIKISVPQNIKRMKPKDEEFYVGYFEKAPESHRKLIRNWVIGIAIFLPIVAMAIVTSQRGFSVGKYEFGNLTQIEGIISMYPVPMIKILTGTDTEGKSLYQSILLVNFAKFGAEEILMEYTKNADIELQNALVTLEGTLDYRDGKGIMELTKKEKSFISIRPAFQSDFHSSIGSSVSSLERVTLQGEITDPKCYFGAMKPGEGKPHKACAALCIAGGIPPVFITTDQNGKNDYYLLVRQDGKPINQDVLDLIGEPVSIQGVTTAFDDWTVLQVPSKSSIIPITK